jgi:hypothetical protein
LTGKNFKRLDSIAGLIYFIAFFAQQKAEIFPRNRIVFYDKDFSRHGTWQSKNSSKLLSVHIMLIFVVNAPGCRYHSAQSSNTSLEA